MRSSYRPRDSHNSSNHGFRNSGRRGVGGGGGLTTSGGAATSRVTAPRPVQTSSLKAESGVFDLTTILVPAASKEKGGTWGRAANPIAEAKLLPASSSTPSAPAFPPMAKLPPGRDAAASPTSSERSSSPEANNGNRGAGTGGSVNVSPAREEDTAAVWDHRSGTKQTSHDSLADYRGDALRDFRSTVPVPKQERVIGSSPSLASASSTAAPLSDELFPPLGHTDSIEKLPKGVEHNHRAEASEASKDATASSRPAFVLADATPAPSAFQTPSPDEADNEEEKERRRRALALEQQRLILEQVEAARAAAKASSKKAVPGQPNPSSRKKVSVIMRRASDPVRPKADVEDIANDAEAAPLPPSAQPKVIRKGPRTKGKLYTRRSDGCLVEEGSGETLSDPDEKDVDGTPDESDQEASAAANPDTSKTGNGTPHPHKGKPSSKKKWASKNRRPKKQQVAAVVED